MGKNNAPLLPFAAAPAGYQVNGVRVVVTELKGCHGFYFKDTRGAEFIGVGESLPPFEQAKAIALAFRIREDWRLLDAPPKHFFSSRVRGFLAVCASEVCNESKV